MIWGLIAVGVVGCIALGAYIASSALNDQEDEKVKKKLEENKKEQEEANKQK
jgi:uncharacterized membrane-anchored protein YhcB (DUF1043 family)